MKISAIIPQITTNSAIIWLGLLCSVGHPT